MVAGAVGAAGAAAAAVVLSAPSAWAGSVSALSTAQAALGGGGAEVLVTAFDHVDRGRAGTNTAVDVFVGEGVECLAEGPADFARSGLSRAGLTGRLLGECHDPSAGTVPLTVDLDLRWAGRDGVRPAATSREGGLTVRLERPATASGSAVLRAPGLGLDVTASPTGSGFDQVATQLDVDR